MRSILIGSFYKPVLADGVGHGFFKGDPGPIEDVPHCIAAHLDAAVREFSQPLAQSDVPFRGDPSQQPIPLRSQGKWPATVSRSRQAQRIAEV